MTMLHSIRGRLMLIMGLLVITIAGVIGTTLWVVNAQKADAVVINLAGRQRMLSQKFTKELFAEEQNEQEGERTDTGNPGFRKTQELFEVTLKALTNGGKTFMDLGMTNAVEIPGTNDPDIRAKLTEVNSFWNQLTEAANTVVTSDQDSQPYEAAFAKANTLNIKVLKNMNAAVGMFQKESETKTTLMTTTQYAAGGIALVIFGFSMVWLTLGLMRPMSTIVSTLQTMTEGEGDKSLRLDEARKDELGRISGGINTFMQAVQDADQETQKVLEMMRQLPLNVMFCDPDLNLIYMNDKSYSTLKSIEHNLPVKADDMIGVCIDVFHKDPPLQRRLIGNPRDYLPHKADIVIGGEDVTLEAVGIWDQEDNYLGAMATWTVTSEQKRLEREQQEAQQRERAAAEELQDKVDQLLVVAVRAGEGDLTESAPFTGEDSMGQLADGFGNMIESISKVISDVSSGSSQIDQGSQQISQSSQDLSEGASNQAASLEQISASLEEMSSMTSQNAENARQAASLSAESQKAADRGTAEMGEMSTAMDAIKKSSDEIAKVIKVIDEIAFQTNLLALNAAVEAARAGEAGKGFAVVAEEVRNLAKRSAEAAKETSTMIDESTNRADAGVEIASRVGGVLGEIEISTNKVNTLLGEIASASREQADGVDQINKGVTELDKVTQQTAGNSEELAAAAEETASQVGVLRELVTRFKIKGESEALGLSGAGRPSATMRSSRASVSRNCEATHGSMTGESDPRQVIPLDDGDFEAF